MKKISDINGLKQFFEKISDNDGERDFELKITHLVRGEASVPKIEKDALENWSRNILQDDAKYKKNIRYAAFYVLAILYRDGKKFKEAERLIYDHESEFAEKITYPHLRLLHSISLRQPISYDDVLGTYERRESQKGNAGLVNMYAATVAYYYEQNCVEKRKKKREEDIGKALIAVDDAIRLDPTYIRYHYNKSRLLFLAGNFDEALEEVDTAILKQLPNNSYTRIISDYQSHKMKILVELGKREIAQEQANIEKEVEKVKGSLVKNIEIVGFFAAVVAFSIGSIQIVAVQENLTYAMQLIVVLFASLLSVFSAFGIILHGWQDWRRSVPHVLFFVVGIAIAFLLLCLSTPSYPPYPPEPSYPPINP